MQGPRPSPLPLIWHYFNISKHLLYGITWTFLNIYSVVTLYIDIHYIPTHYEFKTGPKYHHFVRFKSVRLVTWWQFSSIIDSLGILSCVVVFVSYAFKFFGWGGNISYSRYPWILAVCSISGLHSSYTCHQHLFSPKLGSLAWILQKVLQDFWTCLQAIACWTVSTSLFLQFIFWRRPRVFAPPDAEPRGNKKEFNVGKLYEILALGSPRQNSLPLLSFYCYEIQGCAKWQCFNSGTGTKTFQHHRFIEYHAIIIILHF